MISIPVRTQRSASGESHIRSFVLSPSISHWLSSLQVAAAVCSVQVGGGRSHGTEDGNRTGQDEVHKTAFPVLSFILTSLNENSCFLIEYCNFCFFHTYHFSERCLTLKSTSRKYFQCFSHTKQQCTPSPLDWWPET